MSQTKVKSGLIDFTEGIDSFIEFSGGNSTVTGNLTVTGTLVGYTPTASLNISNWDTAYGWGNHASAGYLTSFTESDPTVPYHVKIISISDVANWNSAYWWGNHAGLYLGVGDKAADSELLDGIDSTQFLRSDESDTMTGSLTVTGGLTSSWGQFSQSAGLSLGAYQTSATNSTTAIIRQTGQGGNGNQDIGLVVDIQGANDVDRIANFRYYNGSTYESRMLIQRGGNVGIGTSSPSYKLTVKSAGSSTFPLAVTNTSDSLIGGIYQTGAGSGQFYLYNSAGAEQVKISTIDDSYFNGGNVGIGTTSPATHLHVSSATHTKLRVATTGVADASVEIHGYDAGVHIGDPTNGNRWAIWNDGVGTSSSLKIGSYALGTWYADSSQAVTITSAGLVGIGTVSPVIALSVRKDVNDWIGQFKNYGDSAYGLTVDLSGSTGGQLGYALGVYTQGGTGMFVRNDGRVGIGTTSPAVKLHVDGNALLGASTPNNFGQRYLQIIGSQGTWGNSSATLYLTQLWNGVAYHAIIEAQQGKVYGNAASDLVFKTSYYSGGVNTVERMRITDDGRVGIGTNSPSNRLSVEGGSIKLNNNNASANYYLWLNKQNSQDGGILLSRDNVFDWQIVNATTSGDLWAYAYGAGTVAMAIKRSNAYVGIGITSPSQKLTVQDGYIRQYNNSMSTQTAAIGVGVGGGGGVANASININTEFGIGSAGYVLVEITTSVYCGSGTGGGVHKWIAGGYSGHTLNAYYHKHEVIANSVSNVIITPYNPSYDVYGVTIQNNAGGGAFATVEIRVTSTY